MRFAEPIVGKYTGASVDLPNLGLVGLTQALAQNNETGLYLTDHRGVLIKMFDLSCGKADEVSYGPYMAFQSELANFEDVLKTDVLRAYVPRYYGAQVDFQRKHAFIAMELLEGQDLKSWCEAILGADTALDQLELLRWTACEMLSIIDSFHRQGFVLIDFKPDNVIRLEEGAIKLVDLGALFAPRHGGELQTFVYSATPEHAEVLIDASNLQAGLPPSEASDVFAAGVALFELATGTSRLVIEAQTADEILAVKRLFLFQDSQTRDVWRAYPHLREALPLLQTQLAERRVLFADFWPLLKSYLAHKVPEWESLAPEQRDQILLTSGTTFITEQLPPRLTSLAGPIARATTLRSLRLKSIADLGLLLANPVAEHVVEDVDRHNCLVRSLRALELPSEFSQRLNTWEVRRDARTGHWAIAAPAAIREVGDVAQLLFLKHSRQDDQGHRYWHVVDDLEADRVEGRKLTLQDIGGDHRAWLGTASAAHEDWRRLRCAVRDAGQGLARWGGGRTAGFTDRQAGPGASD